MGTLRISYTNLIETATLKNGTGGGAPPLNEVSPWVTTNAQNRDRGLVWQQSTGASAGMSVDFTLAATSSPGIFAALGHRGAPSTGVGVATINIYTQAGAYAAAGTWTFRGVITLGSGVRDGALVSTVSNIDSIRYEFVVTSAFTLGRIFAGTVEADFGILSSPGYSRRPVTPILESRLGGGSMSHVSQSGDEFWEISLPYEAIDATLQAKLLTLGRYKVRSVVILDQNDAVFEARVRNYQHGMPYETDDLHTGSLELETLG